MQPCCQGPRVCLEQGLPRSPVCSTSIGQGLSGRPVRSGQAADRQATGSAGCPVPPDLTVSEAVGEAHRGGQPRSRTPQPRRPPRRPQPCVVTATLTGSGPYNATDHGALQPQDRPRWPLTPAAHLHTTAPSVGSPSAPQLVIMERPAPTASTWIFHQAVMRSRRAEPTLRKEPTVHGQYRRHPVHVHRVGCPQGLDQRRHPRARCHRSDTRQGLPRRASIRRLLGRFDPAKLRVC